MSENVGSVDRVLRIIIGLALLSLLVFMDGSARWLGLIGLIPLGTAAFRWCPLYTALGLRT
jgi:hypothetical protein